MHGLITIPHAGGERSPMIPLKPTRHLTNRDCISLIIGIIVGAGIFETSPMVAGLAGSPLRLVLIWVAGGVLAIAGALSYAELVTAFPDIGGDFSYLRRSYGRRLSFLFAWCDFLIIRPCNLGMMAYVGARYAVKLFPVLADQGGFSGYALGSVLFLGTIHCLGLRPTVGTLHALSAIKVLGLAAVIATASGLVATGKGTPAESLGWQAESGLATNLPLAMILTLFTYGGWAEVSFVAGEIRDPQRNAARSLMTGVSLVTAIYVAFNVAVLLALGREEFANSPAVAHEVVERMFGSGGARLVDVLICLSCLGAMHGTMLSGSRLYSAWGNQSRLFHWLAAWHPGRQTPTRAVLLQTAVAVFIVLAFGPDDRAFERLIRYSTPFYWTFFSLVALTIFLLRQPAVPTGSYRCPGYPAPALLLFASSVWLAWSSIHYAVTTTTDLTPPAVWALLVPAAGIAASFCDRAVTRPDAGPAEGAEK